MKSTLTVLLLVTSLTVSCQQRPFWNEIHAFKQADLASPPEKNAIVFVGSSSFRLWKDINEDFSGYKIINRGFGGSSLPHVIEYADDIVIPYEPRQIVIYCGENDFTVDTVTSEIVADRFKTLFNLLRQELPRVDVIYVSMKPSPSRKHLMAEMKEANESIKEFLSTKRKTAFVDIWDAMLDGSGQPRPELFVKDMLHMNDDGYTIWEEAIRPHLKK